MLHRHHLARRRCVDIIGEREMRMIVQSAFASPAAFAEELLGG